MRRTLETVARRYSRAVRGAPRNFRPPAAASSSPAARTIRRRWRRCAGSASQTPETVTETVRGWHFGRFAAMRSTAARESLTEITPALLEAFARAGNPDAAVRAFDRLLRRCRRARSSSRCSATIRELLDLLATDARRCAAAGGDFRAPAARRRRAARSRARLGEVGGRGRDRGAAGAKPRRRREATRTCSTGRGCSPPSSGS